ncbi:MAG: ABC transporter ATP-binding protein [Candidatus Koribacter versatilis]|uniref:ABC transporter ATP-binding protein n=1 Tax=Candidatus Korobacter versatilis TaxID=658062 RepID=A0A932EQW7_9BACT|nr:ABC transporter ATP-binding protein [Candidatus Koribacter versatilis]
MLLTVNHLDVDFSTGPGWAAVVREVAFEIGEGESLGLVGESGSGKSVTALSIMRLLTPQARVRGEVTFDGQELLTLDEERMRAVRGAGISMIFQEPMTALNPVMRVGDQVAEAVLAHESAVFSLRSSARKKEARAKAVEMLREVQIPEPERRARDYPHQLSGGQRQRVMIAMAIVNRPRLLIADEPTTALDVTVQQQILELLAGLRKKFGLAMLFISHDLGVVSQVADRVAVMYQGAVVEMGPVREIFAAPAHPYTKGLLAAIPTLRSDRAKPLETVGKLDGSSRESPPIREIAAGRWVRL